MTLAEGITMCLDRTGLSNSTTTFKDRARQYISFTAQKVGVLVNWWFLDQTVEFKTTKTFTVSGASAAFTAGETITGGSSSSTAVVDSHDNTNAPTLIYVYSESAAFTATETVTGGTSGSTATYASTANTRIYTPVAGNITNWWSFMDSTNQNPLSIVGPDQYDLFDEDRTETGAVEAVLVSGVDSKLGYPKLELWRTPGTTNEIIRARYRLAYSTWGSASDNKEFIALGVPQIMEMAVVHGATELYLKEKGNHPDAAAEASLLLQHVTLMKKQNLRMQGNRRSRSEPPSSGDDFYIPIDSTLASA